MDSSNKKEPNSTILYDNRNEARPKRASSFEEFDVYKVGGGHLEDILNIAGYVAVGAGLLLAAASWGPYADKTFSLIAALSGIVSGALVMAAGKVVLYLRIIASNTRDFAQAATKPELDH